MSKSKFTRGGGGGKNEKRVNLPFEITQNKNYEYFVLFKKDRQSHSKTFGRKNESYNIKNELKVSKKKEKKTKIKKTK